MKLHPGTRLTLIRIPPEHHDLKGWYGSVRDIDLAEQFFIQDADLFLIEDELRNEQRIIKREWLTWKDDEGFAALRLLPGYEELSVKWSYVLNLDQNARHHLQNGTQINIRYTPAHQDAPPGLVEMGMKEIALDYYEYPTYPRR